MNEGIREEVGSAPIEKVDLQTQEIIAHSIEDIRDYADLELRTLLNDMEIEPTHEMTADDLEAIRRRANVLLQQSETPMTAETALVTACYDRLKFTGEIGAEALKALPVEVLRTLFYGETQVLFTDEEIQLFKDSPLTFEEWGPSRKTIKETLN